MTKQEIIVFYKKHLVSISCGLLTLAVAGGIYFRGGESPAAEAELTQKSTEAERYALNIKNSDKLKEQVDALVVADKEIESRLVRYNQLGVNNQYFFKLESETGVKLVDFRQSSLQPAAKGAKTTFIPVGFSVSVQGNLAQLMEFLHRLEGGAHYCRVLSATCAGNSANRNAPLTLALTLEMLGLP